MHGHIPVANIGQWNPVSNLALERSDGAQQAAAVRRKLRESAMGIEVESSSESELMVARWAGGREQRRQGQDGSQTQKANAQGLEEEETGEPISVWA